MVGSAESKSAVESLRGIVSVNVLLEEVAASSLDFGVTEDSLRTQVELGLRRNGIKIEPPHHDVPTVYVRLGTLSSPGIHCYDLEISVFQNVTLVRNPYITVYGAKTWTQSYMGLLPSRLYADDIRTRLSGLLDMFLNDYLTANPK
jgi:hypothetical protein